MILLLQVMVQRLLLQEIVLPEEQFLQQLRGLRPMTIQLGLPLNLLLLLLIFKMLFLLAMHHQQEVQATQGKMTQEEQGLDDDDESEDPILSPDDITDSRWKGDNASQLLAG